MLFYGAQNGHGTVVDEVGPLPHRGLLTLQRTGLVQPDVGDLAGVDLHQTQTAYDESGLAAWPKLDVNFTNKTQFVYRINKGILDVAKDKELNASMPDDSKRIPFTNMIYIGDGLSDVPCMKMMRAYGGQAVAVYQDSNRAGVEDLLAKGRVDFIFPADYRDGTLFDETMKNIVRKIAIADALAEENQQQLRSLGRSEVPQQVGLF